MRRILPFTLAAIALATLAAVAMAAGSSSAKPSMKDGAPPRAALTLWIMH